MDITKVITKIMHLDGFTGGVKLMFFDRNNYNDIKIVLSNNYLLISRVKDKTTANVICSIKNSAAKSSEYTNYLDFSLNMNSILYDTYKSDTIPIVESERDNVYDFLSNLKSNRDDFIKLIENNPEFRKSIQLLYDIASTFIKRNRRCVNRILAEVQNGGRK